MSEEMRKAQVHENGKSKFAVDLDLSGHRLEGDEPETSGGANLGPAPYDMLLGALGECTSMTIRWYAEQQKWPLEKVEVTLTHHKDKSPDGKLRTDYFTKDITLHGAQLTPEQRTKLIEIAAKCPVQRTMEGTPVFQTKGA